MARSLPGFNDGTASRRRIGVSKVVSTVGVSHTLCSGVWFGAALRSWPARYEEDHEQYIEQADQIIASGAGLTDKQKMIAEYWALGPGSVTPPGRWFEFAQYISERDHHTLDDDVKLFFILCSRKYPKGRVCYSREGCRSPPRGSTGLSRQRQSPYCFANARYGSQQTRILHRSARRL